MKPGGMVVEHWQGDDGLIEPPLLRIEKEIRGNVAMKIFTLLLLLLSLPRYYD